MTDALPVPDQGTHGPGGDQDPGAARQPARGRRARDRRRTETAATRSWCSSPGSPTSRRPNASSSGPRSSPSSWCEDAAPAARPCCRPPAARCPTTWRSSPARATSPGQPMFYLVRREAVITGRDLKSARAGVDPQTNAPDVELQPEPAGGGEVQARDGAATWAAAWPSSSTAAWPAPPPSSPRSPTKAMITGRFTTQEADELAKVLRAGALPATLQVPAGADRGPLPGQGLDPGRGRWPPPRAWPSSPVFMLVYYKLSGVNAVVALARQPASSCSGSWPTPAPPSPCPASPASSSPSAWASTPTCSCSSASARSCATARRCARP